MERSYSKNESILNRRRRHYGIAAGSLFPRQLNRKKALDSRFAAMFFAAS